MIAEEVVLIGDVTANRETWKFSQGPVGSL